MNLDSFFPGILTILLLEYSDVYQTTYAILCAKLKTVSQFLLLMLICNIFQNGKRIKIHINF